MLIKFNLLSNDDWGLPLKLNDLVSFFHILADLFSISQGINVLQENRRILSNLLGSLCPANVSRYVFIVIWAIKLKSLTEPLKVSTIPIVESRLPKLVLFILFFLCENDLLNSRQEASILGFEFLL
jgi:hypothetical protein